jgi:hypothetical protein
MADALVLEFDGVDESQYRFVSSKLGIDADTGIGDWPAGLVRHSAGPTDGGGFVVLEVWESRDAQAAFMDARLNAALSAANVPPPSRVTWVELIADHRP